MVLLAGLLEGGASVEGGIDAAAAVELVIGIENVACWCDVDAPHTMVQDDGLPLCLGAGRAEEKRGGDGHDTYDVLSCFFSLHLYSSIR